MASVAFEASLIRPGMLSTKTKPAVSNGLELRKPGNQLMLQEAWTQLDGRPSKPGARISAVMEPMHAKPHHMGLPPSERDTLASKERANQTSSGKQKDLLSGTVKEAIRAAVKAVEDANVETVATVALYAGVAAVGTILASRVVGSIDSLPLVPGIMQVAGMTYCSTVAARFLAGGEGKTLQLEPSSPMRAVIQLVDAAPSDRFTKGDVELPPGLDPKVQGAMQQLVNQRNAAVKQARDIRAASSDLSRLLAEKEALESVALQLAQERDSAMSELNMLKNSVEAMTERMRGIDEMLALEVRRLQEQNNALESVAFALASERDQAIKEVDDLKLTVEASDEEKKALEILAAELIQERDEALAEVDEYKKIVAALTEATGSSSGLTSQQETFLKNRIRVVRSQFVDITRPYDQQMEKVDLLVAHMAEEYGAPSEWTLTYMTQFLKSSSNGHTTGAMKKTVSHVEKTTGSFYF